MTGLEQLCTACARCCNGQLFAGTMLEPAEVQRFDAPELPQPCPHLVGGRCAVYQNRPKACAAYLCPLAKALERGELELEAALARLASSPGLPRP